MIQEFIKQFLFVHYSSFMLSIDRFDNKLFVKLIFGVPGMSRIKIVDDAHATGEIKVLFEAVAAMLGRVPNSYRALARVPLVSKLMLPLNGTLQREGAGSLLTSKIKEIVIIKTSQINACNY